MASRFTTRRAATADQPLPPTESPVAPAGPSWTPLSETVQVKEPAAPAENSNPLLSDKLLDAKVRLHRRLIEEINLATLERLPEEEMRQQIQQLVTQYIVVE